MKKFNFCLVVLANLFLSVSLFSQSIAITDDDTYNANPSAMLDVKSLTKGMLVPRLTTVQRNAVSNPATGLLVFDSDAGSFYFYNGTAWTNLSSGNANGIIGYTSPEKVYLNDITDKFGVGTISPIGKMEVKSDVSIGNENPIFNVVNSTGDTVFAVYEQGVRINVYDDPLTKASGSKGGFAVGGFSPAKGTTTNEYLRITPDSIRLYVEDVPTAKASGSKGGFAVGGFSPAKVGLTNEYLRVTSDSTRVYTTDTISGFGVQNIGATSTTSYMQLTPKNYFIGHESGKSITSGRYNSFMGYQSGKSDTSGSYNLFLGYQSGITNTNGYNNIFIGYQSGNKNTEGYYNSANGYHSLYSNTTGFANAAFGMNALAFNTTGQQNTACGYVALYSNSSGRYNTAIGDYAFFDGENFWNSTAIGFYSIITSDNQVRIGNTSVTSIGGQVGWTTLSDGRFKKNISENVHGLDFILKLQPITYNIDIDKYSEFLNIPDSMRMKDSEKLKSEMLQTGFIAQEVEKAAKELGYDFSGVDKPKNEKDYYGLRYAEFTVPLVKAVQELNAKNEELTKENEVMKIKIQEIDNLKAENLQMKEDIENIKSMLNYSTKK